jgi:Tfp pilus assembly protein FimT
MLEIVIVIAIIGILAAIAIPSLSQFTDRYRLINVTNDYAQTVNLTRVQAITENRAVRVVHVPDITYHDGNSSTTMCQWDVQALANDGGWETVPIDGTQGVPANYAQTGFYDISTEASPKHVKHISMQTTGGITVPGVSFTYDPRGFIIGSDTGISDEDTCLVETTFRNKNGNEYAYRRVCVDGAGIARLISS